MLPFPNIYVSKTELPYRVTKTKCRNTGVLISPYPDQEGNKLHRQKILIFIYPIYYHNWRNISVLYVIRLASKEIFSPSNEIHREVGRAKDLSAPRVSRVLRPISDRKWRPFYRI